jgi:glycosyltransferase involved in cell wall biosynthesis
MPTTYAESNTSVDAQEKTVADASRAQLLYMCDFPPSNFRGGTVTMSRLLSDYPPDRITVIAGSHENSQSLTQGKLQCKHLIFPTSNETGRWGLGRAKTLLDWILIPALILMALWTVYRTHTKVIVTIADGHFFIAAAVVSLISRIPLILILHDDWVASTESRSYFLCYVARPLFKVVVHRARHIYAVSSPMQEMLQHDFGVESELQMPAGEPWDSAEERRYPKSTKRSAETLRILYAGTGSTTMQDSLDLLVEAISTEHRVLHNSELELHLYTPTSEAHTRRKGWDHPRIRTHGWVDQEKLKRAIADADVLFLPFSFKAHERYATERAFPSKTSDYLASGKPILVLAPPYSSIVRYAREFECAEIVESPDLVALTDAINRLATSKEYRAQLGRNSRRAFFLNHDMTQQRASFTKLISSLTD